MDDKQFKEIDPEYIEDLLYIIEQSFNIKFADYELQYVSSFKEILDHTENKIIFEHVDDCTTQQAFYKLREAIIKTQKINRRLVVPSVNLSSLFPRKTRRKRIKELENRLNINLYLLRPRYWITLTLVSILLISFITVFFIWYIGILAIITSIIGIKVACKFGKDMDIITLGELAQTIAKTHYVKARRNEKTGNRKEIRKILEGFFCDYLDISAKALYN